MAKQRVVFEDNQGREHETAEEADRANKLHKAVVDYREAATKLSRALGDGSKTGDGVSFCDLRNGPAWVVRESYLSKPVVRRIWVWWHDCVVLESDESIRVRGEEHDGNLSHIAKPIDVDIKDVFTTEKAARARWVELCEKFVAYLTEEIEEEKNRANPRN